jgi:hypothetical protein
MTGLIGRFNKTRRRSFQLRRMQSRKARAGTTGAALTKRHGGVVVVREYRRDPNWTEWTFTTPLKAAESFDTVELLGRDNDDPVIADAP